MRKLIINSFITLDGVMQAPPEEDSSGNFSFGGWYFNYWDEMMRNLIDESMKTSFDLLLGRKTYEIFASHWTFIKNNPVADRFNTTVKYVVTKSLNKLEWNNSYKIKGDIVHEIKKIKEQEGPEIHVHGSGSLLQTLMKHNLVDELHLWIYPVVIGKGKRLFGQGLNSESFRLINNRVSSTEVITAVYEPAGKLKTGSFAPDSHPEAVQKITSNLRIKVNEKDNGFIHYDISYV